MSRGITGHVEVDWLGNSPAAISRKTGMLFINPELFWDMSPEQRLFIIYHELGHRALNTTSEHLADAYAASRYFPQGHSLKESVRALTQGLDFSTEEHYERAYNQYRRALEFDQKAHTMSTYTYNPNAIHFPDPFLGFGKEAKKRREQNRREKEEREAIEQDLKDKKKMAKIRNIESKAQSRIERSQNRKGMGDTISDGLKTLGAAASNIFGNGANNTQPQTTVIQAPEKDNTVLIIVVVVVVLIAVVGGIIYFNKKKKGG